ncbi:hypothetical protein ACJDU8_01370 [Clostridium sp. WILCCON 0269]|uniref:STAS domain-containing protein n=1 Tax=Candidatus Clostridium eludens TaxID=3381663 RepID=A0ABW8SEQ8_9CLOT
MKKHEMALNKAKKEFNVKIWGMYEASDAKSFIEEFKKIVSTIQTADYILCFDSQELKVSTRDMVPMLESCFKMYKDLNFKKVIMKAGNNATLKMQLTRIGRNVGLNVEVI